MFEKPKANMKGGFVIQRTVEICGRSLTVGAPSREEVPMSQRYLVLFVSPEQKQMGSVLMQASEPVAALGQAGLYLHQEKIQANLVGALTKEDVQQMLAQFD